MYKPAWTTQERINHCPEGSYSTLDTPDLKIQHAYQSGLVDLSPNYMNSMKIDGWRNEIV